MSDAQKMVLTKTGDYLYIERRSDDFLAEPINAFSNGSFLLAAVAAWWLAHKLGRLTWQLWVLIGLAASIAVGSFLFHAYGTYSTKWMDLVPIFSFQIWFLWQYARRFLRYRADAAAAVAAVFFVAMIGAQWFPHDWLNGSLLYSPAFLMLLALGVHYYRHQLRERWLLLGAAGVFAVALFFRSLDMQSGNIVPWGTHFLWHLFNGGLIYLTMRALIVGQDSRGASTPAA